MRILSPLVLSLLLVAALPVRAQPGASQPSFLVIVTDDQRWDAIDATHSVDGVTPVMPTLESLAAEGIRFTNAHTTATLCGPSRAALLTGQYAHNSGVLTGSEPWGGATVIDDSATLATWLDAAGYRTGLVGFYQFAYGQVWPEVPPGWDEWHAVASGRAYDFALLENGAGFDHQFTKYESGCAAYDECPGDLGGCEEPANHQTEVLRDKALAFLDAQPADEPFFLLLTLAAPHIPACPVPQDVGSFDGLAPWRPPSYDESEPAQWNARQCPLNPKASARMDADRQRQLEALQGVDRTVGSIVARLDQLGRADDTLLVFTSDNGFRWGEHCSWSKPCANEECTRVPLVMRWPDRVTEPRSEDWPVRLIDLAPTLVELAGGTPTIPVDGSSLVPLLDRATGPWPPEVLVEWWRKPHQESKTWQPPNHAALRAEGFKFIQYDSGERELFNLVADPFEIDDLSGEPQYAVVEQGMRQRIAELGHRFGCDDGIDTDGDGLVDMEDPGCVDPSDLSEQELGHRCDDGVDNDGDGFYDIADVGCADLTSFREDPACNDGVDNDGDGTIDGDGGAAANGGVPLADPDPTCEGLVSADFEGQGSACGLGVELLLLAPVLRCLRGRRRAGSGPADA